MDRNIADHPNPAFSRDGWMDLNGSWQFAFDGVDEGLSKGWQKRDSFSGSINVPFVYQSPKSGINSKELCSVVWYKRTLNLSGDFAGKKTMLHFGAVDYSTTVWVNGQLAGEHKGGYSSFVFDISYLINAGGENDITVRVQDDDYEKTQMRGKQLWSDEPFGCWYTRYTGIWQPVWLEVLSPSSIENFELLPDSDTALLHIKADLAAFKPGTELKAEVFIKGTLISSATTLVTGKSADLTLPLHNSKQIFDGLSFWSPDDPNLYDVMLQLTDGETLLDTVKSYFGLRKLETADGKVLLNDNPFYQRLVLYQGYYAEGYITPEDDERIKEDIRIIKEMGYNGIRIHQKIESPRFLYWCDCLGLVVWEEMPSMYEFDTKAHPQILKEMLEIVGRDKGHPSIFTWVLFNESWGIGKVRTNKCQQEFTLAAYHAVKAADDSRFIISNDGWEHTISDLCTLHDYCATGEELTNFHGGIDYTKAVANWANPQRMAFADGYEYTGQPYLLSEYGGISFLGDSGWGYNDKVEDEKAFLLRLAGLTDAIKQLPYMQGYCYTQFTDVEHEQNGLLTIDRQPKAPIDKIREINLK